MIGWGAHFQVSGLSKQEPGSGDQVQVRVQEIWPLTTVIDSAFLSFRVAGGGTYPFSPPRSPQRSPQFSPPISPLPSVICHRFSHPRCPCIKAYTPPLPNTLGILPNRQPLTANR